ncbi:MAG: hypothetical protein WC661_21350 [Opitutaceae bacterium]|jgi:hypothetical protein
MSELDHIIRTIPFDHLLMMLAVLAALDAGLCSPSTVLRQPSTGGAA